ncbi:hypothetical protein [Photobacterium sp. TLY01]|uniref:hypothetical protein n=1 Tax=Photobacterium sp. TLY01 TaxID=2907534 RepID=UPI001F1F967E|nr:hypothetical protein [Photobacterium sp. TLY01]UIP27777.1 hypothetical protein LN341_14510 [Photobacterium sp. TLY01]
MERKIRDTHKMVKTFTESGMSEKQAKTIVYFICEIADEINREIIREKFTVENKLDLKRTNEDLKRTNEDKFYKLFFIVAATIINIAALKYLVVG